MLHYEKEKMDLSLVSSPSYIKRQKDLAISMAKSVKRMDEEKEKKNMQAFNEVANTSFKTAGGIKLSSTDRAIKRNAEVNKKISSTTYNDLRESFSRIVTNSVPLDEGYDSVKSSISKTVGIMFDTFVEDKSLNLVKLAEECGSLFTRKYINNIAARSNYMVRTSDGLATEEPFYIQRLNEEIEEYETKLSSIVAEKCKTAFVIEQRKNTVFDETANEETESELLKRKRLDSQMTLVSSLHTFHLGEVASLASEASENPEVMNKIKDQILLETIVSYNLLETLYTSKMVEIDPATVRASLKGLNTSII